MKRELKVIIVIMERCRNCVIARPIPMKRELKEST